MRLPAGRRGLTVIELVIIIVILAIVATLVIRAMSRDEEPATGAATEEVAPAGPATATRLVLDTPIAAEGAGALVPVVVRATDDAGTPVESTTVEFSVAAGGGSVDPASARTDAAGMARASWTLGRTGGDTLHARVPGGPTLAIPAGAPATATP